MTKVYASKEREQLNTGVHDCCELYIYFSSSLFTCLSYGVASKMRWYYLVFSAISVNFLFISAPVYSLVSAVEWFPG